MISEFQPFPDMHFELADFDAHFLLYPRCISPTGDVSVFALLFPNTEIPIACTAGGYIVAMCQTW